MVITSQNGIFHLPVNEKAHRIKNINDPFPRPVAESQSDIMLVGIRVAGIDGLFRHHGLLVSVSGYEGNPIGDPIIHPRFDGHRILPVEGQGAVNKDGYVHTTTIYGAGGGSPTYARPDGEGGGRGDSGNPRIDKPRLLYELSKLDQGGRQAGDERVSDPMPGRSAAARGAASQANRGAAAAAAEAPLPMARWRFAGPGPKGSLVFDPANPDVIPTSSAGGPPRTPPVLLVWDPIGTPLLTGRAAAGRMDTVKSVAGAVQRLENQAGRAKWVPVRAGDQLGQNMVVRVHKSTGGELGFALKQATDQNWTKVAETKNSVVYRLTFAK